MNKIKACVFASGTGSNFESIMNTDNLPCEIALLICDKPGAKVIEKAESYGVPSFLFDPKSYDSKASYEEEIKNELMKRDISWIFLAGYMRIVGQTLLQAYEGRIVNIHPSLLPNFPGKDAIGQAFQAGVKETGITVHFIDEGIDTGPIIAQETVPVLEDDTEETLKTRIQKVEHQLYPRVIKQLLQGE